MKILSNLRLFCIVLIILLFCCKITIYASGTQTKIMKGIVTNVAFGSHAGNITVKNTNQEIEFFGNNSMKVIGGFPYKGDDVTVYYHKTSSLDTPYMIDKLVKSNVPKVNKKIQLKKKHAF
jgi:hypothetical protein